MVFPLIDKAWSASLEVLADRDKKKQNCGFKINHCLVSQKILSPFDMPLNIIQLSNAIFTIGEQSVVEILKRRLRQRWWQGTFDKDAMRSFIKFL